MTTGQLVVSGMITATVNPQNLKAAHDAGKAGAPSPKLRPGNNYQPAEQRVWEANMCERCRDQCKECDE